MFWVDLDQGQVRLASPLEALAYLYRTLPEDADATWDTDGRAVTL
jgi:hypothetical protein